MKRQIILSIPVLIIAAIIGLLDPKISLADMLFAGIGTSVLVCTIDHFEKGRQ